MSEKMSDKMIRKTVLVALIVLMGLYQSAAQPTDRIKIDDDIELIQMDDSILYIHPGTKHKILERYRPTDS